MSDKPEPAIMPLMRPSYGRLLADRICARVLTLMDKLKTCNPLEAERLKNEFYGDLIRVCEGTLEHMQVVIDEQRRQAIERANLTIEQPQAPEGR